MIINTRLSSGTLFGGLLILVRMDRNCRIAEVPDRVADHCEMRLDIHYGQMEDRPFEDCA